MYAPAGMRTPRTRSAVRIAARARRTAGIAATAAAPRHGVVTWLAAKVMAHAAARRVVTRRMPPCGAAGIDVSAIVMPARYQTALMVE